MVEVYHLYIIALNRDDFVLGSGKTIVIVGFDFGVTDFIGGSENFFDAVGEFVDFAVARIDGF